MRSTADGDTNNRDLEMQTLRGDNEALRRHLEVDVAPQMSVLQETTAQLTGQNQELERRLSALERSKYDLEQKIVRLDQENLMLRKRAEAAETYAERVRASERTSPPRRESPGRDPGRDPWVYRPYQRAAAALRDRGSGSRVLDELAAQRLLNASGRLSPRSSLRHLRTSSPLTIATSSPSVASRLSPSRRSPEIRARELAAKSEGLSRSMLGARDTPGTETTKEWTEGVAKREAEILERLDRLRALATESPGAAALTSPPAKDTPALKQWADQLGDWSRQLQRREEELEYTRAYMGARQRASPPRFPGTVGLGSPPS